MVKSVSHQYTTSLPFKLTLKSVTYVADLKPAFLFKDAQKPLNLNYLYVWIK